MDPDPRASAPCGSSPPAGAAGSACPAARTPPASAARRLLSCAACRGRVTAEARRSAPPGHVRWPAPVARLLEIRPGVGRSLAPLSLRGNQLAGVPCEPAAADIDHNGLQPVHLGSQYPPGVLHLEQVDSRQQVLNPP